MSEKEVDYSRMLTGLSMSVVALNKHKNGLVALKGQLLSIVEQIDMVLAEDWGKESQAWYDTISKEHGKVIRDRYERERLDAASSRLPEENK